MKLEYTINCMDDFERFLLLLAGCGVALLFGEDGVVERHLI